MTLRDYLLVARRWWWLVVLGSALAAGAAYLITTRMTPVYQARAVILVNQGENSTARTYNDILGSQSLTKTYAELVTSNINLSRASEQLKDTSVPDLEDRVSAKAVPDTQLIEVLAEDGSKEHAALVANTVAGIFPAYIQEAQIAGTDPADRSLNTVFVAETAVAPESPIRPNESLNVALGALIGFVLMVAAVAFVEYLDDGIDEREDVTALDVPFLGAVFQASPPKGVDRHTWVPSIIADDPRAPLAESYRQVQANLAFALSAGDTKVLLVTSPGQGEGKSTTAANLAEALAESSRRVLLVDGDLRKPDAHRYFSLPNNSGLTSTFLVDVASVPSFVDKVGDSLSVLTGGPIAPNPTELLGSHKMRAILETLAAPYDVVVVDSPPTLGLADSALWMSLVDGVLVVARRGKTRRGPLEETIAAVRASRKPLVGVVLNGSNRKRARAYDYGAAYYTKANKSEP